MKKRSQIFILLLTILFTLGTIGISDAKMKKPKITRSDRAATAHDACNSMAKEDTVIFSGRAGRDICCVKETKVCTSCQFKSGQALEDAFLDNLDDKGLYKPNKCRFVAKEDIPPDRLKEFSAIKPGSNIPDTLAPPISDSGQSGSEKQPDTPTPSIRDKFKGVLSGKAPGNQPVLEAGPDLIISGTNYCSTDPDIKITATIKNIGNAKSGVFKLEYTNPSGGKRKVTGSRLKPGESETVKLRIRGKVTVGYQFRLYVFSKKDSPAELNMGNNVYQKVCVVTFGNS